MRNGMKIGKIEHIYTQHDGIDNGIRNEKLWLKLCLHLLLMFAVGFSIFFFIIIFLGEIPFKILQWKEIAEDTEAEKK